jgi:hypothetical protein
MIQLWLLTIFYLIYTGILLMTPSYGVEVPSLLNVRDYLFSHEKLLKILALLGYLIGLGNLFLPLPPGPIGLGDLLPALASFWCALWFTLRISKGDEADQYGLDEAQCKKYRRFATFLFVVSSFHFILPAWVIL